MGASQSPKRAQCGQDLRRWHLKMPVWMVCLSQEKLRDRLLLALEIRLMAITTELGSKAFPQQTVFTCTPVVPLENDIVRQHEVLWFEP